MNGISRISSVHTPDFSRPLCIFPNVLARCTSVCIITIAMFLSTYHMYPHVASEIGWGPDNIKKMSEVGNPILIPGKIYFASEIN